MPTPDQSHTDIALAGGVVGPGAEVVLTDQAVGLLILECNARLNTNTLHTASCQPPTVFKLTWLGYIITTTITIHLHHQHLFDWCRC
jgi:hypothetical protein